MDDHKCKGNNICASQRNKIVDPAILGPIKCRKSYCPFFIEMFPASFSITPSCKHHNWEKNKGNKLSKDSCTSILLNNFPDVIRQAGQKWLE